MRQEDLDKLTNRVDRILSEGMLPPDTDYKLVVIVAEKESGNINLSLGSSADMGTAAALCEMALQTYIKHLQSKSTEALIGLARHVLASLMAVSSDDPPAEEVPPSVTKH